MKTATGAPQNQTVSAVGQTLKSPVAFSLGSLA